jgi:acyl-CoA thioesterase
MKVENLKKQFDEDSFSSSLGIKAEKISDGEAETSLILTKELLNFFGAGHGGAIYALADVAFSLACNADEDIEIAVALNSNINYIKKTNAGDILRAKAKVISKSRKTSITDIKIYNQNNEIIAKFEGLAYLKRKK